MKTKKHGTSAEFTGMPESIIRPAAFYSCKRADRLEVGTGEHLAEMRTAIDDLVRAAGLTLFGSSVERYSDEAKHGYTYLAWIGESAIDIHTWPEYGSAIVNTHLCNITHVNDAKVTKFFAGVQKFFKSKKPVVAEPAHLALKG